MVYPTVKKYYFVDFTFDLSDQIEKNRHFVQKYQVIIIVCSAILLMVMLALGLVTYVRRIKLRKEGNLQDMDPILIFSFAWKDMDYDNLLLTIELFPLFVLNDSLTVSGMNIRRQNDYNNEDKKEDMELPIFDLITISNATDNFANNNKLGEGGFGSVYKVNNNLTSGTIFFSKHN